MLWEELTTVESIQELIQSFANFEDAQILDIKYFSADRTNPEFPDDTSYENRIYASILSKNPQISEDPQICNIILKFTGIDHLNIKADKGDTGELNGVCLNIVDGKFIFASDPNFLDYYPVSEDPIDSLPTFIIADALSYVYGTDAMTN